MRTSIFLILFSFSIMGFLQNELIQSKPLQSQEAQSAPTYEYLSMTQLPDWIFISMNSESFKKIGIKDEMSKSYWDHSPLVKRIEEYEDQGWELVSNSVGWTGGGNFNNVLMRRKK